MFKKRRSIFPKKVQINDALISYEKSLIDERPDKEKSKFKLIKSYSLNDNKHPTSKKRNNNNFIKRSHSMVLTINDKTRETHQRKYKLNKKNFVELELLFQNFDKFYKEIKKLISNVIKKLI